MSKIEQVAPLKFIGQANLATALDENGSLTSAWNELIGNGDLAQLDQLVAASGAPMNRSTLIVFSPYSFIAWVGVVVPAAITIPAGLHQFDLPASQVAKAQQKASIQLPLPLGQLINATFDRFEKAGITLPEHLGQTNKPYFLESYQLDDAGEITSVTQQIYLGTATDDAAYFD
ncbi:hypothetical protein ACFQ5M_12950 [Agrilactobacillus yilanensis]|uniref:AraC family transcriptional regulator n=1 Tax=Agrilactobacillus yilanensis TaxID=2485997 RepID=A0ABW4J9G1_9LACO|nr:hypothetical protein [Agrilactobacillus yilanensis]